MGPKHSALLQGLAPKPMFLQGTRLQGSTRVVPRSDSVVAVPLFSDHLRQLVLHEEVLSFGVVCIGLQDPS